LRLCRLRRSGQRRRRGLTAHGFSLASLFFLTRLLLGKQTRIFRGLLAIRLFFDATAIFRLDALDFAAFRFDSLRFQTHGLFGLALLRIDVFLLLTRLLLQHISLDVRALHAHFHVHGACTALRARELDLALLLALQRDFARRAALFFAAMTPPQMSKELELRFIAYSSFGAGDLDAGLIELHEQPIDRYFQDLGKLRNSYIGHELNLAVAFY
jgi:hypothetical protein